MVKLLLQHTKWVFEIALLLVSFVSKGQTTAPFIIGSVGFNSSAAPVYSQSAIIEYKSCLNVSNGISILLNKKKGIFLNQCLTNSSASSIGLTPNDGKIFPNPASTHIFFNCATQDRSSSQSLNLTIYSADGQMVRNMTVAKPNTIQPYLIDLKNLPNGQYFLRALSGNQTFKVFKFQIIN